MTLAQFPTLQKLSSKEKLKLAEELWFSGISDQAPVSASHKRTLDKRWAAYQAGSSKRISLAELERRLAKK